MRRGNITITTQNAWAEAGGDEHAVYCAGCRKILTIGMVAAFTPSVGDKPVDLYCERCI